MNLQISHGEDVGAAAAVLATPLPLALTAAHVGVHPQEQLLGLEGLHQVVVGPALKPMDLSTISPLAVRNMMGT